MQPEKQQLQRQAYSRPHRPKFKLFTACENLAAALQADKIQDQLESMCQEEFEFVTSSLEFASFHRRKSWKDAVVQAATADMIIIAMSGANELPSSVQSWIQTWPGRTQTGRAALVTVFDLEQQYSKTQRFLASYCRRVARDRGLDFFCNREVPERPNRMFKNPQAGSAMLANLPPGHLPMANWGIND